MGCSKPSFSACPTGYSTSCVGCFGCMYYIPDYPAYPTYVSGAAKPISEFSTDELLAEIKRRMGA